MALFVTKDGKKKSPMALICFFVILLYCAIYGILYALLVEPLYKYMPLDGGSMSVAVHSIIIAVIGTAVCCLLFFLKDKRIVPYSFAFLLAVVIVFCLVTFSLDSQRRDMMLNLIMMYTLAPVMIGNIVSWLIYMKLCKTR